MIIGAGAKVLGPITVGDNARVGSNAVVLDNVPDDTTVVGIPARPVDRKPTRDRKVPAFDPYGIPCDDSLDPLLRDLDQMHCELAELEARVARWPRSRCASARRRRSRRCSFPPAGATR